MKKMIENVKAKLYNKEAESQSVGTIVGIIAAVVLGIAIIGIVIALITGSDSPLDKQFDKLGSDSLGATTAGA